ncbi:hypothetical protein RugamoR57_58830 [Duganella caerulea]
MCVELPLATVQFEVAIDGAAAFVANDDHRLSLNSKMADAAAKNTSAMRCWIADAYDVWHIDLLNLK